MLNVNDVDMQTSNLVKISRIFTDNRPFLQCRSRGYINVSRQVFCLFAQYCSVVGPETLMTDSSLLLIVIATQNRVFRHENAIVTAYLWANDVLINDYC